MTFERRRVGSFWDLGTVAVPPLPAWTVLVDRVTGVPYALAHDGANVVLDAGIPLTQTDLLVYSPHHGPRLTASPLTRLFVSSAVLGHEQAPLAQGVREVGTAPPFVRRSGTKDVRELVLVAGVLTLVPFPF